MRWYFSYPILAAGLAFAGHTYLPHDPTLPLAEAARTAPLPPPAEVVDLTLAETPHLSRVSAFAPDARLFQAPPANVAEADDTPAHGSVLSYLARTLTLAGDDPAATAQASQEAVTASEWKSAVVHDVATLRVASVDSSQAARRTTPSSRVSLTRDIQQELRRVGCYWGEVDGVWGGGSKRAMTKFMDRVNASLPTHQPDVFMLSLLRAQDGAACGASCPAGQSLTGSGRCLPSTLIAQGGQRSVPTQRVASHTPSPDVADIDDRATAPRLAEAAVPTWQTATVQARREIPYPHGRMAMGGPKPDDLETLPIAAANGAESYERTAALAPSDLAAAPSVPIEGATPLRATSFDDAPIVERSSRATINRPRAAQRAAPSRRNSNYRHVQRLFEHPLGRM